MSKRGLKYTVVRLVNVYYYYFYVLFKFYEAVPSRWWSDWKAAATLAFTEIIFFYSLVGCLEIVIGRRLFTESFISIPNIVFLSSVVGIKYYAFLHTDAWKQYVKKFDKLPHKQNMIGKIMVWVTLLLAMFLCVSYFYTLSVIYKR